jgi:hypothetical protein
VREACHGIVSVALAIKTVVGVDGMVFGKVLMACAAVATGRTIGVAKWWPRILTSY